LVRPRVYRVSYVGWIIGLKRLLALSAITAN
jgi:hypothetical protein